jgi:hypothetical protein
MADNGTTLMAVDGDHYYLVTLATNAFAAGSDPDFQGADVVVFVDGYFIFNVPGTGQFMISGINDTTIDALDIATSEGNPDNIVSIVADHRDVWMLNEDSTEVFQNTGNADFPFERITGAFIEYGCAAPFTAVKMASTVFWVGKDKDGAGMVVMAKGYQPQRISTHAVEAAILSYGDISDATAWTYQQDGHNFYLINFPNADSTWCYDVSTGQWHERSFNNEGVQERHRAENHSYVNGTHVIGDYQTGKIYELSPDIYSDNGTAIKRVRRAPHLSKSGVRLYYDMFQLDVEVGVGIDGSGQGTDPQVMMRYSNDGAKTWSNERWVSMGAIGKTLTRVRWPRCGSARDRVFEITISDPVKAVLIGADINFSEAAA